MSYVNDDDKYANGKITQFREHLSRAVKAHSGKPFEIFQDKKDIKWGQQWQERINDALDGTLFLIPIITPSFFNSLACRDELERFLKREKGLGRGDLILPVYYFDCPVLNDKEKLKQDPLVEIIAARQREDWRELRHHSFKRVTPPLI
ncbi:MAG: TIR domain-containing protein [Candidatus Electrothrix sp. ATG2]|nr:TIR domain-containing protein [Candidatus Electrothrix sp. ATG2]